MKIAIVEQSIADGCSAFLKLRNQATKPGQNTNKIDSTQKMEIEKQIPKNLDNLYEN